jgi:hypothetical protein
MTTPVPPERPLTEAAAAQALQPVFATASGWAAAQALAAAFTAVADTLKQRPAMLLPPRTKAPADYTDAELAVALDGIEERIPALERAIERLADLSQQLAAERDQRAALYAEVADALRVDLPGGEPPTDPGIMEGNDQ